MPLAKELRILLIGAGIGVIIGGHGGGGLSGTATYTAGVTGTWGDWTQWTGGNLGTVSSVVIAGTNTAVTVSDSSGHYTHASTLTVSASLTVSSKLCAGPGCVSTPAHRTTDCPTARACASHP